MRVSTIPTAAVISLPFLALATPIIPRVDVSTVVASTSTSASTDTDHDWASGGTTSFSIHQSCNSTLKAQLEKALGETVQLAQHAKEHILRWGHESPFVQKYFGNGSTAMPIGWYERVASADKSGVLFRCDDPDRNCATQSGKKTTSSLPAYLYV
jgi:hypothetical protein